MSYEEEFDRLMREKSGEMNFSFDDAHWQKASRLIDQSRGVAGGWKLKAVLWGGIAAVGAGLSWLMVTELATGNLVAVSKPVRVEAPRVAQDAATSENVIKDPGAIVESPALTQPGVAQETQPFRPAAKYEAVANHIETAGDAINDPVSGSAANAADPAPVEQQGGIPSPPAPIDEPIAASAVPATMETEEVPAEKNTTEDIEVAAIISAGQADRLDGRSVLLEYSPSDHAVISLGMNAVPARDDDYYDKKSKGSCFYADVAGGGAYNTGWERAGEYDGRGFNWYGGVNAGFFLGKKLSLSTGFQAFNVANISRPFHAVKSLDYDFSSATSRTVMTCSQLQYFAVPLRLNYHFAGGNILSFGILGTQLWRADNTIKTTVTRDNSVLSETSQTNHNLYEGMTQQQILLNAGYSVKVSRRFYVSAELVYGLGDLYEGGSYYARGKEALSTVRLGIIYRVVQR